MDSIFHRVSIRKFQDKPVEPEKIEKLLRAAMAAPSAGNQQPWEFYVVINRDLIQKLAATSPYTGCAKNAPVLIVSAYREDVIFPMYGQEARPEHRQRKSLAGNRCTRPWRRLAGHCPHRGAHARGRIRTANARRASRLCHLRIGLPSREQTPAGPLRPCAHPLRRISHLLLCITRCRAFLGGSW